MPHAAVMLIENDPAEAVLASAAVAMRPDVRVLRAPDLRAGVDMLADHPVALVILGRQAIGAADALLLQAFVSGGVPVIGIGAAVREPERKRALAAGVSVVHERPREWPAYRALVAGLLAEWLPTRTD